MSHHDHDHHHDHSHHHDSGGHGHHAHTHKDTGGLPFAEKLEKMPGHYYRVRN